MAKKLISATINCDPKELNELTKLLAKAPEGLLADGLNEAIVRGEKISIAGAITTKNFKFNLSEDAQACYKGLVLQYPATKDYVDDLRREADRKRKKAQTEKRCPVKGGPCPTRTKCSECYYKDKRDDNPFITFDKYIENYGRSGRPTEDKAIAHIKYEELVAKIRKAKDGEKLLRVYDLAAEGYDQKAIAKKLKISESTVSRYGEKVRLIKIRHDAAWGDLDPRIIYLLDALDSLNKEQSKVIRLAFYKNKNTEEIAHKLKISIDEVEEIIDEASGILRKCIEEAVAKGK